MGMHTGTKHRPSSHGPAAGPGPVLCSLLHDLGHTMRNHRQRGARHAGALRNALSLQRTLPRASLPPLRAPPGGRKAALPTQEPGGCWRPDHAASTDLKPHLPSGVPRAPPCGRRWRCSGISWPRTLSTFQPMKPGGPSCCGATKTLSPLLRT